MSNEETKVKVTLDHLTFTFEDIAKIDSILGTFPYRSVQPIYEIINQRMTEQATAKYQELQIAKEGPKETLNLPETVVETLRATD